MFSKVSYEQFRKDFTKSISDTKYSEEDIKHIYSNIKLPVRATRGSAGYDFFLPYDINLLEGCSQVVPSGVRCHMTNDCVLLVAPRSGLGFKHKLVLDNTLGVIDSDYFYSSNEGHIMIKVHWGDYSEKLVTATLNLNSGDAICQGILVKYETTFDDKVTSVRDGGFGSTDK